MTNKQAINWIINLMADIGKIEHQELWHYEQALSEIKELLESKIEYCGERLIDADAFKDILENRFELLIDRYGIDSSAVGVCGGAIKLIDLQPTVEPGRKTGQWIEFMDGWGKCPFCGNQVEYPDQEWNDFCGQCGAEMRKGTE